MKREGIKQLKRNNQGFSLLEVLLAMAILAIVFVPLMNYFTDSIKYNNMSKIKQKATLLAQNTMEDLKNEASVQAIFSKYEGNLRWEAKPTVAEATDGMDCVYYGMEEMDGSRYDVKVEVKARTEKRAEIIPMSLNGDFIAVESGLERMEAINYFAGEDSGDSALIDDISQNMSKTLYLDFNTVDENMVIHAYSIYTYGVQETAPNTLRNLTIPISELRYVYLFFLDEGAAYGRDEETLVVTNANFSQIERVYLVCKNKTAASPGFHLNVSGLSNMDDNTVVSNAQLEGVAHWRSGLIDEKEVVSCSDVTVSVYPHHEVEAERFHEDEKYIQLKSVKGE